MSCRESAEIAQTRPGARLCAHTTPRGRQDLPLALVEARRHRRERVVLAVAAAWLAALLVAVVPTLMPWPDAIFVADFSTFWTSAWIVREGAGPALFDVDVQAAFWERLKLESAATEVGRSLEFRNPYFYPPLLALLFLPLTLVPVSWAYLLWCALSLLALIAAIALPARQHPMRSLIVVGALSYLGVVMTLREGQVNALLPLSLTLSMLALARGRPVLGGVLLGLLWLKPQYALLFPLVFLVKRRWGELAGMAGMGALMAGASLILLGPEGMVRYLDLLRGVGSFYPSLRTWAEVMVNWRALIMGLAPGLSEATGTVLMLSGGIGTALLSLLAWQGRWAPTSPRFPVQVLVTALATIIVAPHSHLYGTVIVFAPLAAMMSPTVAATLPLWIWHWLGLGYLLPLLLYLVIPAPAWLMAPYYFLTMLLMLVFTRSRGTHS